MKHKVFSVGMPRTGNQSLRRALEILGYRDVGHDPAWESLGDQEAGVELRFPIKQIEASFPGTRYVLTIREDPVAWLASCRRVAPRVQSTWNPFWFSEDWMKCYQQRLEEIAIIPSDRVLMFDVYRNDWAPLCGFLGRPDPGLPFPHVDNYR